MENEKYSEIFKLASMLLVENIEFKFQDFLNYGYQILLYDKNGSTLLADCIEHEYSLGNDKDLLEIMGGLTEEEHEEDTVLGYLTAEEVFKRFKYCYENNTSIYVKGSLD